MLFLNWKFALTSVLDEHPKLFRNSKNMPEAVQSAVKDVLVTHGVMSTDQADEYLRGMDKDRRYQAETWS